MTISTQIRVMNNVSAKVDTVRVETSCISSLHVFVPPILEGVELELNRKDLIEFLLRTQPTMVFADLAVNATERTIDTVKKA